jgi:hypothetical protein
MVLSLSTNTPFHCQEFPGFGTLCGNWPGFPVAQTGYLLAPDGSPLHAPVEAGGGMTVRGDFFVGIGPNVSVTGSSYETSGVHLDFLLPDSDFEVTGARLRFVTDGRDGSVQFGTAAQLPDGDSWSLAPAGLCVIFAARFLRDRRHRQSPT